MADDLIRKSDVLETYAELYDIFDDNKAIQEELHEKLAEKLNLKKVDFLHTDKRHSHRRAEQFGKTEQLNYRGLLGY